MKKYLIAFSLILFLILLVGGVYFISNKNIKAPHVVSWKTYTDADHGFSIQYTDDFLFKKTDIYNFLVETKTVQQNTLKGSVMVAVEAIQNTELSGCLNVPEGYKLDSDISNIATTTINGKSFFSFDFISGKYDERHKVKTFRMRDDSRCYLINAFIDGNVDEIESVDASALMDKLYTIVETFKLVK